MVAFESRVILGAEQSICSDQPPINSTPASTLKAYEEELDILSQWAPNLPEAVSVLPKIFEKGHSPFIDNTIILFNSSQNNTFRRKVGNKAIQKTDKDASLIGFIKTKYDSPSGKTLPRHSTVFGFPDEISSFILSRNPAIFGSIINILGLGDHSFLHNFNTLKELSWSFKNKFMDAKQTRHLRGPTAHEYFSGNLWFEMRQEQAKRNPAFRSQRRDELRDVIEEINQADLNNPKCLISALIGMYDKVMGTQDQISSEIKREWRLPVDTYNSIVTNSGMVLNCIPYWPSNFREFIRFISLVPRALEYDSRSYLVEVCESVIKAGEKS